MKHWKTKLNMWQIELGNVNSLIKMSREHVKVRCARAIFGVPKFSPCRLLHAVGINDWSYCRPSPQRQAHEMANTAKWLLIPVKLTWGGTNYAQPTSTAVCLLGATGPQGQLAVCVGHLNSQHCSKKYHVALSYFVFTQRCNVYKEDTTIYLDAVNLRRRCLPVTRPCVRWGRSSGLQNELS